MVTLELVCNDLGRSMVTDWSPPFNSTGKTTEVPVDRSQQIFSWLIYPLGLSTFSWGRIQIYLSSGRGIWLVPSYNWIRMYGQLDPSEVREDSISRASTIKDTLAWSELIHTMAMP